MDGVETGVLLSDFGQFGRENADVPDFYCTLLDAAGKSPTLVLNQNARERKLAPFQNMNVKSCKGSTRRVVLLLGLYVF